MDPSNHAEVGNCYRGIVSALFSFITKAEQQHRLRLVETAKVRLMKLGRYYEDICCSTGLNDEQRIVCIKTFAKETHTILMGVIDSGNQALLLKSNVFDDLPRQAQQRHNPGQFGDD